MSDPPSLQSGIDLMLNSNDLHESAMLLVGLKATRRHTTKSTASWNEAMIHEVKNVGRKPTHFIRIDLK
jgi:hypothetical protein